MNKWSKEEENLLKNNYNLMKTKEYTNNVF